MSEMVERVARAMYASLEQGQPPYSDNTGLAAAYGEAARVANAAMREPTEAQIQSGHIFIDWCRDDQDTRTPDGVSLVGGKPCGTTCRQDLTDAWRAMVDEALK